jgi:hypothetical protein
MRPRPGPVALLALAVLGCRRDERAPAATATPPAEAAAAAAAPAPAGPPGFGCPASTGGGQLDRARAIERNALEAIASDTPTDQLEAKINAPRPHDLPPGGAAAGAPPAAPPPTDPGALAFELDGRAEGPLRATGAASCERFGDPLTFLEAPAVAGPGAEPDWTFRVELDAATKRPTTASYYVGLGDGPIWEGRVTRAGDGYAATLVRAGQPKLTARFTLRCAAAPTALPEAAVAYLARVAGREARPYATRDFGRERVLGAMSIVVAEDAQAWVDRLRAAFGPGWLVVEGTSRWLCGSSDEPGCSGGERNDGSEVVVVPGATVGDVIRLTGTNGVNHGYGPDVVAWMAADLAARYGADLRVASTDTLSLHLCRPPTGDAARAFFLEMTRWSPDTYYPSQLDELMKDGAGLVHFWWD